MLPLAGGRTDSRHHSLIGRIDDRLMREAFKTLERNRGAANCATGREYLRLAAFEAVSVFKIAVRSRRIRDTRGPDVHSPESPRGTNLAIPRCYS
jgi:hypothetical protein